MGDDDELGVVGHAAQVLRVTGHVDVVQRSFDLIEEAERRGIDVENGKIDRNSDQCLLAAGEGAQVFDDLARGRDFDFDAGFQHIAFVREVEPRMAAAEQFFKDLLEVVVDLLEARREQLFHLAAQFSDHAGQLALGLFDVRDLGFQEVVTFLDFLIFLDGADVDVAQTADLAADLGHAAAQLGQGFKLDAEVFRFACGELVLLPQLGIGVVQLVFSSGAALGQAGHLAAHPLALVGQGAVLLP